MTEIHVIWRDKNGFEKNIEKKKMESSVNREDKNI